MKSFLSFHLWKGEDALRHRLFSFVMLKEKVPVAAFAFTGRAVAVRVSRRGYPVIAQLGVFVPPALGGRTRERALFVETCRTLFLANYVGKW